MPSHLRRRVCLTGIACLIAGTAVGAPGSDDEAAPGQRIDPQAVLAASDLVRNPQKPFGVTVVLVEYRDGREIDSDTLAVYSKIDPKTGRFRTLIRYVGPARDAGKLVLENGTQMWFYDPASEASIRISPRQRLLGQASTGDVVTVNFARDYRAMLAAEETVLDGDRKRRQCYLLRLHRVAREATYHRIDIWVDQSSHRPVKAKFYSDSGRLLKIAYYRKFRMALGRARPTQIVIIDGLTPSWVTVMSYTHFAWREVPDSWLQRDYLPRFRPQ